jgi:predicted double-glycine peptidase/thiol-disulfide isomerase/thioredoxin
MRSVRTFVLTILSLSLFVTICPYPVAGGQFLPYYREATCGANCLYAVCLLKSVDTTLKEVYRLANITEKGTSMLDLAEAARKLGLHPQPLKTTVKKLQKTDAYAIVHLKRNHFVLCVGCRGDDLVIVDPPKDAYLMKRKDFQEQWTGYALLFERTTKSNNDSLPKKSAHKEKAAQQTSVVDGADGNGRQIPETARVFLAAINKQKSSRDEIRGLHEMLNKSAPEIQPNSWLNCSPLSLEKLRGRIVVLEFWNIGCNACRGEIGNLNRIYESSKSIPVTVISIHSYTNAISEVKRVINEINIQYPVCVDKKGGELSEGKTFEQYATNSVPRRFLIDIYGRIRSIATVVGPTLEELIRERADGVPHVTSFDLHKRFGVNVAPKRISFGKLPIGHKVQKSVYIYKPDYPSFVVNIASAPKEPATAQLFRYKQEDALLYELRILLPTDLQGENYSSEIKLTTNDIHKSRIIIPVTASIASEEHSNLSAGKH